jgi:hypothetical protein
MVIFTKTRNLEGFSAPKFFDMELILNNQVKYLRVILDSKLNWKFHMDKKNTEDQYSLLAMPYRAITKTWGLKPKDITLR